MNNRQITENDYFLTIHLYTYICIGSGKALLYNTLSDKKSVIGNKVCVELIQKVIDSNTNTIILQNTLIENSEVQKFIKILHNNKFGIVYSAKNSNITPNTLNNKIYFEKDFKKTSIDNILGFNTQEIVQELNQVYLYITGKCGENCNVCKSAYKQTTNCFCFSPETSEDMSFIEIERVVSFLNNVDCEVNILGGDIFMHKEFDLISKFIKNLSKKCVVHINAKHIIDKSSRVNEISNFCNPNLTINFLCNSIHDYKEIKKIELMKVNYTYSVLVKSEEDIEELRELGDSSKISLTPFFDEENFSFFFNNVLLNVEEIEEAIIDMNEISRKENINETYYGRLFIMPNGDTFSNLTNQKLGNIRENSIDQMIIREIHRSDGWFYTREKIEECSDCIYHCFCPSPSNYEKFIGTKRVCQVTP